MKIFSLWVEGDRVELTRCTVRASGLFFRVRDHVSFDLDYRYKAPRAQLARKVRYYINRVGNSASIVLINMLYDKPLLWRKVLTQVDHYTLAPIYPIRGDSGEHMAERFSKKLTQFHSI